MQQRLFAEAKARSTYPEAQTTTGGLEGVPGSYPQLYVNTTTPEPAPVSQMTPSSIYTELSARSDVLPIHPLPVPPVSSDFSPHVISSGTELSEQTEGGAPVTTAAAETSATAAGTQQVLDFRRISMSQPVIVLYNGIQHMVSWQALVSHVATLSQFSQQQQQQDSGNVGGELASQQMPVGAFDHSFMQPSFPEAAEGMTLAPMAIVSQGALNDMPMSTEALFGGAASSDMQQNSSHERD